LKTRWRDGTTHVLMERHELLERLAPLIPPPRAHQVRYHGLLAPCASGRDRVVPRPSACDVTERAAPAAVEGEPLQLLERASCSEGSNAPTRNIPDPLEPLPGTVRPAASQLRTEQTTTNAAATGAEPGLAGRPHKPAARRTLWADLLQRVFEIDALSCPRCGGRMRVLAAITAPDVARRILACLNLPTRAPPLAKMCPAGRTLSRPAQEVPSAGQADTPWVDFEFDQSSPAEWDVGA